MADDTKNQSDQKPPQLEPPKDIEDLLKELPKVAAPKPPQAPPPKPLSGPLVPPPSQPLTPGGEIKSSSPQSPPPTPLPSQVLPKQNLGGQDKFKSYVRTMAEDLEAAKKGLKPEPKPFEIKPPPSGPKMVPPPPPLKPETPQIKLGAPEKAKPLGILKPPPPHDRLPPPITPSPAFPGPKRRFASKPKILILILAMVIIFAGIWFFMTRKPGPKEAIVSTPTITPTPVFPGLIEIFGDTSPITVTSTESFTTVFNNSIKNLTPFESGKFTAIRIIDENGASYTLNQIFERLGVSLPSGLVESLDTNEGKVFWAIFGQNENYDEKGLLNFIAAPTPKTVLIVKSVNPFALRSALNSWEVTMTADLGNLFNINSKEATSETFLDNIYRGIDLRYRNFPYADNTIDYAIVNLPKFNLDYFVLTNSRESIYSTIDLLQNQ